MVRAILEGRKTVTRRMVKGGQIPTEDASVDDGSPRWSAIGQRNLRYGFCVFGETEDECAKELGRRGVCPYGQPGDRLWVRETWQLHEKFTDVCHVVYKASERNSWTEKHRRFPVEVARGLSAKPFQLGWRPSIHMPRWASRMLLEITAVRVERLDSITYEQARAEGYPAGREAETGGSGLDAWLWFRSLWKEINGPGSWDANPWVWVVEFRRVTP
jgi:hypothetical protein